ncbi:topoisomerase II-associated protein PAT1 [Xylariomycetidae sp. FL0641]|nr:topoisomerase II-associated protein PAT1 [Xylariomycetidae sp. FL0641]
MSRPNASAYGFFQAPNDFEQLTSSREKSQEDGGAEALNFEELAQMADEHNDDTFGDVGASQADVGRDFDFFGQTANWSTARPDIERQHFDRQPPASTAGHHMPPQDYNTGFAYQHAPKPVRSGYEKYQQPEPVTELRVDESIWGVAPKKTATPAASTPQPMGPPAAGKKMMSLEEVEAAMRAQPKAPAPAPAPAQSQFHPRTTVPEPQPPLQPQSYPRHDLHDPRQQPVDFSQGAQGQGIPHGHPITILQRPVSKQTPHTTPGGPNPLYQQHQAPHHVPTQILQNPNRLSGEAARMGMPTHPSNWQHHASPRQQVPMMPYPAEAAKVGKGQQDTPLEKEARRAKDNYERSKDNDLMTPQDKSFITRIQLQQLVSAIGANENGSDSALEEDFYYHVLSSLRASQGTNPSQPLTNFAQTYLFQTGTRHGGMRRHGRGPENYVQHMQKMEQQVQRAVEAAKNKPKNKQLVIEGSLGKISFSNAKTPKPLLNIKRADSSSDAARPTSAHRQNTASKVADKKATLRDIESVYMTLMKMEDLRRGMPPPPAANEQPSAELIEKHAEYRLLVQQLWSALKVHEPADKAQQSINKTTAHPFITFLSYPKGQKAIPRVFHHIDLIQRGTILEMVLYHLDQLDVVRGAQVRTGEPVALDAATREKVDLFSIAVMPSLFQLVNDSHLDIVTQALHIIIEHNNVAVIARSRIGLSMLTMILSRAEIIKQAGEAHEQMWQQWVATFHRFFDKLDPKREPYASNPSRSDAFEAELQRDWESKRTLRHIFPGTVTSGEDTYVWQFLAAIGIGANPDEQERLVLAVGDRVMGTVGLAKTLPAEMARERLDNVNLFMRSLGLDVEQLEAIATV